ncbi:MAG: phosphoribosyl-ATP diphosphatase [Gemmatimonadales bacterium]
MIIPSIDIIRGRTVQLVGGQEQVLDAGDPMPWLEKFALAGEVAVVDLDAARGEGSNRDVIARMCAAGPCRVGGGIRDLATARFWLDAGAVRIVIGTAADPALLRQLPRDRVVVALDAMEGEVVVDAWRTRTDRSVEERLTELREYADGFLVTFVERDGRLAGTDLARAAGIAAAGGDARITIAGGVTMIEEIAGLDRIGADAQVGMALYTGRLSLGAAIAAPLTSDRDDGLIATVVTNEMGTALGLAWSSAQSIARAVDERRGVYQSRTRGLWIKGGTSGATQQLLRVTPDCDRDAVRFTVRQKAPGFCHRDTATCWGEAPPLEALEALVRARIASPSSGGDDAARVSGPGSPAGASYTGRLIADPALLRDKLVEEAGELADAGTSAEVAREAADVLYFTMVRMAAAGVTLADVSRELAQRARRITRRPGDRKPQGHTG